MIVQNSVTRRLIDGLVESAGVSDPIEAIRVKASQAIDSFVQVFGEPDEFPLNLLTLASFLGIKLSDAQPAYSPDAELAPDGSGGVELRVNQDRPETRRRFSVGHEITHTFFPDHSSHVWTRTESRYRNLADPDDYLEMLCDIGAAELVLPRRWFIPDARGVEDAMGIVRLAARYKASREATVRRYAELHDDSVVAAFFEWKLKPSQKGLVGRTDQLNLFGISPQEELRSALRLRLSYSIPSASFSAAGLYLPKDKSVENRGPLYRAASTGQPADEEAILDLGQSDSKYRVQAVPLWTPDEERGPNGENAVAAILRPLTIRPPKRRTLKNDPGLFL